VSYNTSPSLVSILSQENPHAKAFTSTLILPSHLGLVFRVTSVLLVSHQSPVRSLSPLSHIRATCSTKHTLVTFKLECLAKTKILTLLNM